MKIITDKGNVFTIEICNGGAVLTTPETLDEEQVADLAATYEFFDSLRRGRVCNGNGYAGPINGIYFVQHSTGSMDRTCPRCDGAGWIYSSAVESGAKCTRCRGTGRIT